jgi:hypothetical protein
MFWFDDDLVDDDEAFIEMLENDEIVRAAFFFPIVELAIPPGGDSSGPYPTQPPPPPGLRKTKQGTTTTDPVFLWNYNYMSLDKAWGLLDTVQDNGFTAVLGVVDSGYFDFYQEMGNRYVVQSLPRPDVHLHTHTPSAPRPPLSRGELTQGATLVDDVSKKGNYWCASH